MTRVGMTGIAVGLSLLGACSGSEGGDFDEVPTCETVFPEARYRVLRAQSAFSGTDDPVDVYAPEARDADGQRAPVAVFLQGGRVDKSEYAGFATALASYGFWVFVPNHHHLVSLPGFETEGLFSEQRLLRDALDHAAVLNTALPDELAGAAPPDLDTLVVLGHSFGAATALAALHGTCEAPFCEGDSYDSPAELAALALLGISMKPRFGSSEIQYTDNEGLPVALINGDLDSNAPPADVAVSFDRIGSTPKASIQIAGGNHYVMCDRDNPPGPSPDPAAPTLDQREGVEVAARWAATFLLAHTSDDTCSLYAVYGGAGDSADGRARVEADLR